METKKWRSQGKQMKKPLEHLMSGGRHICIFLTRRAEVVAVIKSIQVWDEEEKENTYRQDEDLINRNLELADYRGTQPWTSCSLEGLLTYTRLKFVDNLFL